MIKRCYNLKRDSFKRYGGRGIRVCHKWRNYLTFRKWALENGWKRGLQIDRNDNDGDYEPSNCRFVSRVINTRNRSNNKLNMEKVRKIRIDFATGKYTQTELAVKCGISQQAISQIVHNKIWKEKEDA